MRQLFILFGIVFVYFMPDIALQTYGSPWFAYHCLCSLGLTYLISFDKSKYIDLIIFIEILATIFNLIACLEQGLSLKTASILTNYPDIMTALFVAELAIMGVVMLNDGIRKSIHIVRLLNSDNWRAITSGLHARGENLCTIR